MRTLKDEEVRLQDYRRFREVRQGVGRFIEEVCNQKRLHSVLGYRAPSKFEEWVAAGVFHGCVSLGQGVSTLSRRRCRNADTSVRITAVNSIGIMTPR